MSFGYAVTDFIKLGKYAYDLYEACSNAAYIFKELSQQCLAIYLAVGQIQQSLPELHDNNRSLVYIKLCAITRGCRETLNRLEELMGRYPSLGTTSPTAWDTMTFALRLFINNDTGEIRSKLTFHLVALNLFMTNLNGQSMKTALAKLDQIADAQSSPSTRDSLHNNPGGVDPGNIETPQGVPLPSSRTRSDLRAFGEFTADALQKAIDLKNKDVKRKLDLVTDLSPWLNLLASNQQSKLPEQSFCYSKTDEHLSMLPDGWQRKKLDAKRYQYRYLFGRRDRQTRAYQLGQPFDNTLEVEMTETPVGWEKRYSTSQGLYYFCPEDETIRLTKPTIRIEDWSENHFVGWITKDGLPIDLTDSNSVELARAIYTDQNLPWEDIEDKLSQKGFENWDVSCGTINRPIYTDTRRRGLESRQERTVHPAFFQDTTDKDAGRLPPGWDVRLDTWGNVFYVDHNTASAQKIAPSEASNTNTITGLPRGWEEAVDNNGVRYFFQTMTLIATYQGSAMKVENEEWKFDLKRRPRLGEIPPVKQNMIILPTEEMFRNGTNGGLGEMLRDPEMVKLFPETTEFD